MNFGLILDSALVKVSAYLARPSGQTPTHGDVIIGRLETRQSIETLQYSLFQILHRFLSCQTILKGYTYMWGDFWLSHI